MAQLTSRLVISLIDRVSGPARGIHNSLRRLHAEARATPLLVAGREAQRAGQHFLRAGTSAAAGAYGLYRFISAVKEFNEAEFGYAFARLPDHFKGLKLDMESLRKDTQETTKESRKLASELGLIPSEVQRARTEVEKIGISGEAGDSLWRAALGLNMSDADMPTDIAAKYLGAMFRSYKNQREELARRMGVDMSNPQQRAWFEDNWLRGMAAKSAVAAAKSALDPRELIEGARQYAPLWASLGMRPEEVLGALAHGSNFGFMAPELGTAFKSWANRLVKPTAQGVSWMNTLGLDRSKWTASFGAVEPGRAVTRIHSLLGNQPFAGKGGKEFRAEIRAMLDAAARDGTTTSPEFQAELSRRIQKRLGKGWEGRADDIAEAVRNATMTGDGDINIMDFIREANRKGMTRAAMLEILEGRHVARSDPLFRFFDDLVSMIEALDRTGAEHLDAIQQARKESRAGKLKALEGAWEEFLLTVQDSGALDGITEALTKLSQAMSGIGEGPMRVITMLTTLALVAAPIGFALAGVVAGLRSLYAIAVGIGGALGLMGLRSAGAAAAGADMSGATGAAAGAAGKAGWSSALKGLGKLGLKALPVIGLAYGLWELGSALWGGSDAEAAERPASTIANAGSAVANGQTPGADVGAVEQAAQALPSVVSSAMAQVRSIVAGVDLTAEGQRIMQTLANGMRAGIPAIQAAGSAAAAAAANSALRGAYTDGGR